MATGSVGLLYQPILSNTHPLIFSSARSLRVWLHLEVGNRVSCVLRRRFWRHEPLGDTGNRHTVTDTPTRTSKLKVCEHLNVIIGLGEQDPPQSTSCFFQISVFSLPTCLGLKSKAVFLSAHIPGLKGRFSVFNTWFPLQYHKQTYLM